MIRYGSAGWMYADWAGVVYPDPKPKKFDPRRAPRLKSSAGLAVFLAG